MPSNDVMTLFAPAPPFWGAEQKIPSSGDQHTQFQELVEGHAYVCHTIPSLERATILCWTAQNLLNCGDQQTLFQPVESTDCVVHVIPSIDVMIRLTETEGETVQKIPNSGDQQTLFHELEYAVFGYQTETAFSASV
jgi:hypothetical protein